MRFLWGFTLVYLAGIIRKTEQITLDKLCEAVVLTSSRIGRPILNFHPTCPIEIQGVSETLTKKVKKYKKQKCYSAVSSVMCGYEYRALTPVSESCHLVKEKFLTILSACLGDLQEKNKKKKLSTCTGLIQQKKKGAYLSDPESFCSNGKTDILVGEYQDGRGHYVTSSFDKSDASVCFTLSTAYNNCMDIKAALGTSLDYDCQDWNGYCYYSSSLVDKNSKEGALRYQACEQVVVPYVIEQFGKQRARTPTEICGDWYADAKIGLARKNAHVQIQGDVSSSSLLAIENIKGLKSMTEKEISEFSSRKKSSKKSWNSLLKKMKSFEKEGILVKKDIGIEWENIIKSQLKNLLRTKKSANLAVTEGESADYTTSKRWDLYNQYFQDSWGDFQSFETAVEGLLERVGRDDALFDEKKEKEKGKKEYDRKSKEELASIEAEEKKLKTMSKESRKTLKEDLERRGLSKVDVKKRLAEEEEKEKKGEGEIGEKRVELERRRQVLEVGKESYMEDFGEKVERLSEGYVGLDGEVLKDMEELGDEVYEGSEWTDLTKKLKSTVKLYVKEYDVSNKKTLTSDVAWMSDLSMLYEKQMTLLGTHDSLLKDLTMDAVAPVSSTKAATTKKASSLLSSMKGSLTSFF